MAMIRCSECGKLVSSNATSCVGCGNPIAGLADVRANGTTVVTTQATSKKFKSHMLMGAGMSIFGILLSVSGAHNGSGGTGILGSLLVIAGIILFVVARCRAWWNNG